MSDIKPVINLKHKSALVVGGTGFLGIWLSKYLTEFGAETSLIARNELSLEKKNFINKPVNLYKLDIIKDRFDSDDNFDFIFYFPMLQIEDLSNIISYEIHSKTIRNFLNYAKKHNSKFILASTGSVYGRYNQPVNENHSPRPETKHALLSKHMEDIALEYLQKKLNTIILRYFFPYGRFQNKQQFIPLILNSIKQDKSLNIRGSLDDLRSNTYIEDSIKSTIMLASVDKINGIYNVCSDSPISLKSILEIISNELGKKAEIKIINRIMGDYPVMVGDNSKIKNEISYPYISFQEGIKKMDLSETK